MDRITNESSLWLNAIKMEDEGNHLQAFSFYLKDAAESVKQKSLVRAALSCSCAAECLSRTGNLAAARHMHLQTATLYEKNAFQVIGHSVREALWSYQEAYEYFNMAGETSKASNIFERYISLSRKVNPFSDENEAIESLRSRKIETGYGSDAHHTNMQISADIDNEIKSFLSEIGPVGEKAEEPLIRRIFNKISTERIKSEKSIDN